ncbi:MAG: restriction endonuclease subunit S [Anaerolineae bacterium]|nr:restriction endonuclease subunit S [Anaerolineae bacterium]
MNSVLSGQYTPYPAYQPSGIEWQGEIPTHWDVVNLKHLTECLDSKRIPLNADQRGQMQGDYPYWGANGIVDFVGDWLFDEELVLLGEDGAPFFDSYKDVAFLVNGRIWVNNHIHILRAKKVVSNFLVYVLNIVDYKNFIDGSTRDKLTQGLMGMIPIPLPPLPEQQTIAAFLDHHTARIDALIAKQQRLIDLLHEKRTALISHAVTQGLDPAAPMRDSGVAWLGEIPSHWEVRKIKFILRNKKNAIKTGPFGSQLKNSDMASDEVKVYNQRNVIDSDFSTGDYYISSEKFLELREFEIFPDDILITTRGTIGRCAIFPENRDRGILHPCLIRLELDQNKVLNQFLIWYIQDANQFKSNIFFESNATTIEVIYSGTLKQVSVAVPPISEQLAIMDYLDRETTKIDTLVEKQHQVIERLQEYRTALISAAVTGKIDVRRWQDGL